MLFISHNVIGTNKSWKVKTLDFILYLYRLFAAKSIEFKIMQDKKKWHRKFNRMNICKLDNIGIKGNNEVKLLNF